jgi:hypothetical protein
MSKVMNDKAYLIYNQDYLKSNYLLNGIFFIKVFFLLFITLLTIYMFYLNRYSIYFYNAKKCLFTVTKSITLLLYAFYFLIVTFSIYVFILHMYPFDIQFHSIHVFLYLLLFGVYYFALLLLIDTLNKHFLLYFLPFILYFMTLFSIEIGLEKTMVPSISKLLYLLFYDIILFDEYTPYYSIMYYITVIMITFIVVIKQSKSSDCIE